jgi:hypothetical protein
MFGGNGGLLGFIIGNPKYLGGPTGLGGFEPLPPIFNGCLTKNLSTSLGIYVCTLTSFVSFRVKGLVLILIIIWVVLLQTKLK